jgi:hypothetical protein
MSEEHPLSAAQHEAPEEHQDAVAQDGYVGAGRDVATGGVKPAAAPPYPPEEPAEFIACPDPVQDELVDATDEAFDQEEVPSPGANGSMPTPPLVGGRRRRQRLFTKLEDRPTPDKLTATQRLLLLDTWLRSGLPAGDFAPLVGVSKHTLYLW